MWAKLRNCGYYVHPGSYAARAAMVWNKTIHFCQYLNKCTRSAEDNGVLHNEVRQLGDGVNVYRLRATLHSAAGVHDLTTTSSMSRQTGQQIDVVSCLRTLRLCTGLTAPSSSSSSSSLLSFVDVSWLMLMQYYYYYYYAAFNAPCVGHKADESQARGQDSLLLLYYSCCCCCWRSVCVCVRICQLSSVGFKTSTVHRTVRAGSLAHRRRGQHQVHYLTVQHDSGLDLHDECILRRDDVTDKYSLLPLTSSSQSDDQIEVDTVSRDVYVIAAAQFERPFDYSSSTWGTPADDVTSCPPRNASKLRPVHAWEQSGNDVSVFITQDLDSGAFHYFAQSQDNPPYFRFTVPGNWRRLASCVVLSVYIYLIRFRHNYDMCFICIHVVVISR